MSRWMEFHPGDQIMPETKSRQSSTYLSKLHSLASRYFYHTRSLSGDLPGAGLLNPTNPALINTTLKECLEARVVELKMKLVRHCR